MPFRVVLDACVLIPYQLSDLLLRLAEAEIFVPLWSDKIMAEVNQNLPLKLGVTPHKAQRRIDHMTTAFPLAAVEGYKDLIPAMTNDPKDRHVLAAAVRGNADLIVTANLKDFPDAALEPTASRRSTPTSSFSTSLTSTQSASYRSSPSSATATPAPSCRPRSSPTRSRSLSRTSRRP